MSSGFFEKYAEQVNARRPFATATVVRTEKPSSAKPGDKAIINSDGELFGWIGGGCVRSIVIHEGKQAILHARTALVSIAPQHLRSESNGIKTYQMTCHSGGAVDVFIEPVLPKPNLILLGRSAVGTALCKLAHAMQWQVTAVASDESRDLFPEANRHISGLDEIREFSPSDFIVVATQGQDDEFNLEAALITDAPYIAFVSSRKKAQGVFTELRSRKVTIDQLKSIKTPAGLDIGAKLPAEIAVSILAEIIQIYRGEPKSTLMQEPKETQEGVPAQIVNPVCGIPIERSSAKYIEEKDGALMYFCCDGCKKTFDASPEQYWNKLGEMNPTHAS